MRLQSMAAFAQIPAPLRIALQAAAAAVALLAAALLVTPDDASALHRWGVAAAGALATGSIGARAWMVERDRRAWIPLALGLGAYTCGSLLFAALYAGRANPPLPSPADVLWLAFYPAAYATITMVLRRSFTRVPGSMWLDGLVGVLALAAAGIALIHGPVFHDAAGPAAGVEAAYPIGDLAFVVLVLAIAALSGWRPGPRWLLIGGAMACWFVADAANLSSVADGGALSHGPADAFWVAGMGLLGVAPWARRGTPEGLRVEGTRVLVVPAVFSAVALGLLAADRIWGLNGITAGLALGAIAVALTRTALTLREVQLLADARHESLVDELTGLPSRRHFHRRLDTVLREAEVEALPFALLIFDLDRFKELNDTLGHGAGDTLLQLVGQRLRDGLGRGALLARLGGDEFAVLLPPGTRRDAALKAGTKVVESIGQPFAIDGLTLDVGVSVGVALYPEDATDETELLRRADVAMYLAKGAGGGVALYDPRRDLHTRDRLALGQQLRDGLERGNELVVHYQPQVDPQLGRVVGVEALVRWQHPTHGTLMPPDFLPLAEKSGLIGRITRDVMNEALAQVARWRADGLDLGVAINLATADLGDEALVDAVAAALDAHGVPPSCLTLEVTEDGVIADPEAAAAALDAVARLGVRIALDDFGTGWSSLAHLRRLPVSELKIDASFIAGLARDEDDAAIVRASLDLARSLRLRVSAEGVPDAETWTALADLGADAIQGFVLTAPLPAPQMDAWLAARRDGPIARCALPNAAADEAAAYGTPLRFRL